MADQQQLDLLRQGADTWNAWRNQHPLIPLNLSRADLSDTNLNDTNLSNAFLDGADLSDASLSEVNLRGASLISANLSDADLFSADLSDANLSGAFLDGANLSRANLRGASLISANFSDTDLSSANLSSANLSEANLDGANLSRANLSKADLNRASLIDADFSSANLDGANLSKSYLSKADLSRASLIRADLSEAIIGWTIFGDVDLRTVRGLETVHHFDPSTIGTDTISRSEGVIPESFLRKAGVTESFVTYAHSLAQNPIEYYTCFISYSSQDQEFVERLYTDLQAKGVRCWYAPEDLKIGDEFRNRIDESIRLYDKLMVILSQHSIKSAWVKTEVEAAFEKEQRQNKLTLFPIKLDETVMQTTQAWAADIRRRRHIGDFRTWKEYDSYHLSFRRLLRDLKTRSIPPIRES